MHAPHNYTNLNRHSRYTAHLLQKIHGSLDGPELTILQLELRGFFNTGPKNCKSWGFTVHVKNVSYFYGVLESFFYITGSEGILKMELIALVIAVFPGSN